ncbi:5'-methylthioadenosine/S-adenosylhomocysteine nucleosidase [Paenibacillus sp. J31TS4]|uniref:5'-methylthioadenosine/adenosylhomocysteine nucleosidase n=1 Tax=Paenibacillus sp. J31TS4 TaxID=2807195 RepID=UPI001B243B10|nr:5'-methylthioadenosine/adenosylhomocysteine nucleosidase [Paenibacillus sp. J31TS4]GIP39771.1 5'-methylthioadenosine/S-adenosylhomocysteine nucleosidase [Paenibacillus sp. J31TS4]
MSKESIGIIGAMAEEVELLHQAMEQTETVRKAGISYTQGRFQDRPVVVCKSGVGKVNAAVCTQVLIDAFGVDAVVFTGVAGAVDPALEIGDIVVSTECLQHDIDVTALGYERGIIPYQEVSVFTADKELSEQAYETSRELFPGKTKWGRILSGDQFIADRAKVAELHKVMGGACTEMEGAAVAQVCHMNEVPFVVIRAMSDKADGSASVNFPEFTKQASENSYRIVEGLLARLG